MPNFTAHLGMAKDVAARLCHDVVERNTGAFLLGSVTPDVRIITRSKRQETHFVQLDFSRPGEGIESLLRQHPGLSRAAELTEPTRAFIVGYASHLFADEHWIVDLYRPFFGNREVFEDALHGNLMDRALQMELDRRAQERLGGLGTLHPVMAEAEKGVSVGFLTADTLLEWRQWVEGALDRQFGWDRLRFMARRLNSGGPPEDEERLKEMTDEFLASVPDGLERIYNRVPVEKVEAFMERSVQDVLQFAQGYLE